MQHPMHPPGLGYASGGAGRTSSQQPPQFVWATPSLVEARKAIEDLLERLDNAGDGARASLWETELARVLEANRQEQKLRGKGHRKDCAGGSAMKLARPASYMLRPTRRLTGVLAAAAAAGSDHCARDVYDKPNSRSGTVLGKEVRDTVTVVEVREGWLRLARHLGTQGGVRGGILSSCNVRFNHESVGGRIQT